MTPAGAAAAKNTKNAICPRTKRKKYDYDHADIGTT